MKRRDFFKFMGLASSMAISSCKAKDGDRKILPYLVPPGDDIVPGVPHFIRSSCTECPALCGLNVKIMNDKPIKLEGNPDYPLNKGALCIRGQSSLSRLYDTKRIKSAMIKTNDGQFQPISWYEALSILNTRLSRMKRENRRNIFLSSRTTGSLSLLIDEVCRVKEIERWKDLEIFHYNAIKTANENLFGVPEIPDFHIDLSDTLITFGADIFESFLSPVEWMKQFSTAKDHNFYWIHIEPYRSLTGSSSNLRLTVKPKTEPFFLAYLIHHLRQKNPIPASILSGIPSISIGVLAQITGIGSKHIEEITRRLENARSPLIISGGPATANENGFVTAFYTAVLQWMLAMPGQTVDFDHSFNYETVGSGHDLTRLISALGNQEIGTAILSRVAPFLSIPGLVEGIKKASFKAVLSETWNDLAKSADMVLPLSDQMESWGDAEPKKGFKSIIQPALLPLFDSRNEGDILLMLMNIDRRQESENSGNGIAGYRDYLKSQWIGMDEKWIDQGFRISQPVPKSIGLQAADFRLPTINPVHDTSSNSLYMTPSVRTFDGRSSDIVLLTEIPDPLTSISYGKWITLSRTLAEKMDILYGDAVRVVYRGKEPPHLLTVVPSPEGTPDSLMTLTLDSLSLLNFDLHMDLGTGKNLGGDLGTGKNLGTGEFFFFLEDVMLRKSGKYQPAAILSGGKNIYGRNILQVENGESNSGGAHGKHMRYTLYPEHHHTAYRWGMVIDMNKCTGCSACVAACYIENNVPIVGFDEHLRGREMSWIRVQPYNAGSMGGKKSEKAVEVGQAFQWVLMLCQHCDNAPCENVCPVLATTHTAEGLNQQIYNRCVGTRYCSNNCPYKVRRFNWFDNKKKLPLITASNPDVSVRRKGIMEKCTFCTQRIRSGRDLAKDEKRLIRDGEVIPACAQTCPADAIVFGNLEDPGSRVSRLIKTPGVYRVLEELGTEPAIIYIKRWKGEKI